MEESLFFIGVGFSILYKKESYPFGSHKEILMHRYSLREE